MTNIENIKEDVEIGVSEQSIQVPVRVTVSSVNDAPLTFTCSIDNVGQIILTPVSKDVEFISANTEDNTEYETDIIDQEVIIHDKTDSYIEQSMSIVLDTTMLVEEGATTNVSADVDEIGQCVIYPMSKENIFLTVSINETLNLITEEENNTSEEQKIPQDVEATVVENIDTTREDSLTEEQLERALKEITNNYRELEGGIYCDSKYEQDTCAKILSKHYPEVTTGLEYDRLTVLYSREQKLTEELSENELLNVLIRFLQGDITLVTDANFEPKEHFIHLAEVDTEELEYYYDPESDVIGVFKK